MKEIVNRLQENRQLELAKSILEAAGYIVTENTQLVPGTKIKFTYGLSGDAEIVRHHKDNFYFIRYNDEKEEKLFKLDSGEYKIISSPIYEATDPVESPEEQKKNHAIELLKKAKETNDAKIAWELIDYLYDHMLLEK